MYIPVHYLIRYFINRESGIKRRRYDFDAFILRCCLKGESWKGYVEINGNKYYNTNSENLLIKIANAMAKRAEEVYGEKLSIVPVPNSSAVLGSSPTHRTYRIAEAMVRKRPTWNLHDALRWRAALPPSHSEGGSRSRSLLRSNIVVMEKPSEPVLLIDDILTTGAHIAVCAEALRSNGVQNIHAMVALRTVWEQPSEKLEWNIENVQ